jgi:hypothetical protein
MASLVSPEEVRVLVHTGLSTPELQAIIDREEAEVIRLVGPHYIDQAQTISETLPGGLPSLWLRRPVASVISVTEDGRLLTSGEYLVWGTKGQIKRLSGVSAWLVGDEGLPWSNKWGQVIVIVYNPADDNARRKPVIIELVRLGIERTVMRGESVAGEYSYQAPEWEKERGIILHRLQFVHV